jgi:HK97 family phage major capsid protein
MTKETLLDQKRENALKAREILTSPDGSTDEAQKFIDANLEIDKKIELLDKVEELPVKSVETKMENTGRVEFKAGPYLNTDLPFSGSKQEKEYKAYVFGKYLQANSLGSTEAKSWLKNNGHLKANNEGTTTAGGFLTPDIVLPDLIMLRDTYGVVRREAYKVPMTSDVQVVPNLTGDGTAVWGVENTANTAYDLTFANVGLTAKKLNAYNIFSTELRDDAVIDYASAY